MKTLNYLSLLFLLSLFISCSNKPDISGFYVGIKENQSSNIHDLVFFKEDSLIHYFPGINDGCGYSNKGNIFSFECRYGVDFKSRIETNGDTITFYPVESDSKGLSYRKSLESNYWFDYTHERLEIELPNGKGEIKSLRRDYQFKNPLYLYKSKDELMVNFLNQTVQLNEKFHSVIGEFRNSGPTSVIAEKTLTMIEMKGLFDQLKLSGRLKVDYMLDHSEYDEVNFISSFLRPMTQEEFTEFSHLNIPPPPPALPEISQEELRNNGVLFDFSNKTKESLEQFRKKFEKRIKANSNTMVIYYLEANSTYEDYIGFLVTTKNTCLDLRDEFLMKKYEKSYRELIKSMEEKELILEARNKYPSRIIEIDSTELKEIKKDL